MQNINLWIERELDGGSRLMGFGHRVYRTRDPRVGILREFVGELDRSVNGLYGVCGSCGTGLTRRVGAK